jgi:hypothetical protein
MRYLPLVVVTALVAFASPARADPISATVDTARMACFE